jgi:hypothetical protein
LGARLHNASHVAAGADESLPADQTDLGRGRQAWPAGRLSQHASLMQP